MQINIGNVNEYGVVVVGGPYRALNRGNSTKWDFLCPYCNKTFLSPTTRFKHSKSCYSCRGEITKSYKNDTTWDYLYHVVKGRKIAKEKGFPWTLAKGQDKFCPVSEFIDVGIDPYKV